MFMIPSFTHSNFPFRFETKPEYKVPFFQIKNGPTSCIDEKEEEYSTLGQSLYISYNVVVVDFPKSSYYDSF